MTKAGSLAAIILEWWPRSDWNKWPPSLVSPRYHAIIACDRRAVEELQHFGSAKANARRTSHFSDGSRILVPNFIRTTANCHALAQIRLARVAAIDRDWCRLAACVMWMDDCRRRETYCNVPSRCPMQEGVREVASDDANWRLVVGLGDRQLRP